MTERRRTAAEKKRAEEEKRKEREAEEKVRKEEKGRERKRKREEKDQRGMKDAGKKGRLYEFEEICKAKVRMSDGVVCYFVNWDGKGYWETEDSMLPLDDPVKREMLKELLRRVRVKCGILV